MGCRPLPQPSAWLPGTRICLAHEAHVTLPMPSHMEPASSSAPSMPSVSPSWGRYNQGLDESSTPQD